MFDRESQPLAITRQTLLVVTGVTVGLLTLAYVLGVQVGKQSAALRKTTSHESGKDLEALPLPLAEQLKQLEGIHPGKPAPTPAPHPVEPPKPEAPKADPKPEAKPKSEPPPPDPGGPWTQQVLSTSDPAEAKRVVAKLAAAGFQAVVVKDKGAHKVRLAKSGSRESMNTVGDKLKAKGFQAFLVKVE